MDWIENKMQDGAQIKKEEKRGKEIFYYSRG